jgi:hypothetical protein
MLRSNDRIKLGTAKRILSTKGQSGGKERNFYRGFASRIKGTPNKLYFVVRNGAVPLKS